MSLLTPYISVVGGLVVCVLISLRVKAQEEGIVTLTVLGRNHSDEVLLTELHHVLGGACYCSWFVGVASVTLTSGFVITRARL
jgi:hypothetical protein